MVRMLIAALALPAGLASATQTLPQLVQRDDEAFAMGTNVVTASNAPTGIHKLIVGGAGQIVTMDFNGSAFIPTQSLTDTGKVPSWMAFKQPNLLYAVDENSNGTSLFTFHLENSILSQEGGVYNGSGGVVHLVFNGDKTRLIGSSYGEGSIDVWNAENADGGLEYVSKILLPNGHGPDPIIQTQPRAHQAVPEPSGDFFVINDLGGDKIHILDIRADPYSLSQTTIKVEAGSGPRHGAFISINGGCHASHYVVVCELSNELHLYSVSYDSLTGMDMKFLQKISTYGPALPPSNAASAAAGELVVASSGAIYVSNRRSGNETDSISHFALERGATDDDTPVLVFKAQVSSGGTAPRMMSLSKHETIMFVTNLNGANGLVALSRNKDTGNLDDKPLAVLSNSMFSSQPIGQGFGPQFVQELW